MTHYQPQPYVQQSYAPQYAPQQGYAPSNPDDSIGSWMLTLFILGIPLVGFIYLLVVAFGGSRSESRQNFARAALIWQLISIVLSVVLFLILLASGASFLNWVVTTGESTYSN